MTGGTAAAIVRRGVEPYPVREGDRVDRRPCQHHRSDRQKAARVSPPGQETDKQHRQQDCRQGLDDANRAIAHDAIACHQLRDRGGNDLDPRHQRIERRREEIAGAGRGRAEYDNSTLDVFRIDLAADHARGADGANGTARTVVGNRQRIIGSGRYRPVPEQQAVGLDRDRLADGERGHPKRERKFDLVVGPEQHRKPTSACRSGPW